jgi:hypothetical protein
VSIQYSKEYSTYNKTVDFTDVVDNSGTPKKLSNSIPIFKKIQIVPRHVFWDQEEPFDEKTGGEKSRGFIPLK